MNKREQEFTPDAAQVAGLSRIRFYDTNCGACDEVVALLLRLHSADNVNPYRPGALFSQKDWDEFSRRFHRIMIPLHTFFTGLSPQIRL